jgi:hypothetical protein
VSRDTLSIYVLHALVLHMGGTDDAGSFEIEKRASLQTGRYVEPLDLLALGSARSLALDTYSTLSLAPRHRCGPTQGGQEALQCRYVQYPRHPSSSHRPFECHCSCPSVSHSFLLPAAAALVSAPAPLLRHQRAGTQGRGSGGIPLLLMHRRYTCIRRSSVRSTYTV